MTRCKRLRQVSSHMSPMPLDAVLHDTVYFSEEEEKGEKEKEKVEEEENESLLRTRRHYN